MNRKKVIRFLKKEWILVWLISASLLLAVIVAYSEYGNEKYSRIKRVFAPSKQVTTLFTSNYLDISGNHQSVNFNPNDATSFDVYIRNYDPADIGKVYDGNISYKITATLAHKSCEAFNGDEEALDDWNENNMSIVIENAEDASKKITLSGNVMTGNLSGFTLTGNDGTNSGIRDVHQWKVTFTNIPLDSDYCVTIQAEPSEGGLPTILSTLGIASMPEIDNKSWTCVNADDHSKATTAFDAYNFLITGSGGTTLKFSYDTTKLEINPIFCTMYSKTGAVIELQTGYTGSETEEDRTNWKTVEIPVRNDVNRYDIQMYKVDASESTWTEPTWNDLDPNNKKWVEFEMIQSSQQSQGEGGD